MTLELPEKWWTVAQAAKKLGISRARVAQPLEKEDRRAHCYEFRVAGCKRPVLLLIPPSVFAGYAPSPLRQSAGRTPKGTRHEAASQLVSSRPRSSQRVKTPADAL